MTSSVQSLLDYPEEHMASFIASCVAFFILNFLPVQYVVSFLTGYYSKEPFFLVLRRPVRGTLQIHQPSRQRNVVFELFRYFSICRDIPKGLGIGRRSIFFNPKMKCDESSMEGKPAEDIWCKPNWLNLSGGIQMNKELAAKRWLKETLGMSAIVE